MVFWLIRLLIAMLVARLIWKVLGGVVEGAASRPPTPLAEAVPLVRDPVCGTFVDKARALTLHRKGEMHYFCSENCRTAFQQDSRTRAQG
jgi:YHS domain-containing protein